MNNCKYFKEISKLLYKRPFIDVFVEQIKICCVQGKRTKQARFLQRNLQTTNDFQVYCLACAYTNILNCHKDCLFYAALHCKFWFFSIRNGNAGGVSKGVNFTALLYF